MTCEMIHQRGPKVVHDHQTCFACRPDGHKSNIEPLLTPGVFYPKCSLLVKSKDGCEPYSLLTDIEAEKDRIVAVTKCDVDLTETTEADNCPIGVYTNIGLDPNYMCWPEGATAEQIEMLSRTFKDCIWFINRFTCTEVPDELRYLLQDKEVAAKRTKVTTEVAVPVEQPDTTEDGE